MCFMGCSDWGEKVRIVFFFFGLLRSKKMFFFKNLFFNIPFEHYRPLACCWTYKDPFFRLNCLMRVRIVVVESSESEKMRVWKMWGKKCIISHNHDQMQPTWVHVHVNIRSIFHRWGTHEGLHCQIEAILPFFDVFFFFVLKSVELCC